MMTSTDTHPPYGCDPPAQAIEIPMEGKRRSVFIPPKLSKGGDYVTSRRSWSRSAGGEVELPAPPSTRMHGDESWMPQEAPQYSTDHQPEIRGLGAASSSAAAAIR